MLSRTAFFAIPALVLSIFGGNAYGDEEWYVALPEKARHQVANSPLKARLRWQMIGGRQLDWAPP